MSAESDSESGRGPDSEPDSKLGSEPDARSVTEPTTAPVSRPMWRQLFRVDPKASQSLQAQLRQELVKAILDGRIAQDCPLPSSRALASELGVARNTVVLAYQHLVDESYLIARERHGFFVNPEMLSGRVARRPVTDTILPANAKSEPPGSDRDPGLVMDLLSQRNIQRLLDWQRYEYPFIYGQTDETLFPVNDWREAVRLSLRVDAIARWAQDRTDNDDELLVEQILTRVLPRRGVWADADELLITTGAQNALFLIAQLLLDTNSIVGLEDPCYPDARNIFSLFAGDMRTFSVGDQGVETDERLAGCKLLYVTPSHQCPTTTTMPLSAREKLLAQAAASDVTILEDDYESELNFTGAPTPALKSLDVDHRVIYVGSLSKTLAPGLRVGFMVGPPDFIRQARALRRLMYRHPPTNTQRTVGHFLSLGHHDSALLRISRSFRERFTMMEAALATHAPLSAKAPAFGGTSFWVRLPAGLSAITLEHEARARGILLHAGDTYFADPEHPHAYCRLGFSSIEESQIVPGIDRLAALVSELSPEH